MRSRKCQIFRASPETCPCWRGSGRAGLAFMRFSGRKAAIRESSKRPRGRGEATCSMGTKMLANCCFLRRGSASSCGGRVREPPIHPHETKPWVIVSRETPNRSRLQGERSMSTSGRLTVLGSRRASHEGQLRPGDWRPRRLERLQIHHTQKHAAGWAGPWPEQR